MPSRLEGVSFAVAPGEVLAVLGPNGSGKSTLLRLVAGLDAASRGSVAWSGRALTERGQVVVPPEQRGVGLLFQQGVLFPHLDVARNVALGLRRGQPEEAVARALEAMQIAHLGAERVHRLSGGEAQRTALARALVQEPSVMLLDEPFHSLDATVKRSIVVEIQRVVQDRGIAAVLVTHDTEEASALADRVLLLREGRKVQEGPLEELYRGPADLWVARLLGEVEHIEAAKAVASGIALPGGHRAPEVWFRPEGLALELASDGGLEVTAVRGGCGDSRVSLAPAEGPPLSARWAGDLPPAVGQRVRGRIVWALPDGMEASPSRRR